MGASRLREHGNRSRSPFGSLTSTKSSRSSIVHNTKQGHYAIREGNWVLIDAPSGNVSGAPDWYAEQHGYVKNPHPGALFDLSSDIGQLTNLFAEQSDRVNELQELLARTRAGGEVRSR